jgi:regulator of RNase E activity RraA
LSAVSTATISAVLLKCGYRHVFVAGLTPTRPDLRMVGRAFTLRYAPAREDVAVSAHFDNSANVQRLAIEAIQPGEVLVIDARGSVSAGSLGNILATRIMARGAAGIVTDGGIRDTPGFRDLDMAVYARLPHAALSSVAHYPADMQVPIGCGEVLVMPGDVVVGDAEGVVIIPYAEVQSVADAAIRQEQLEKYILSRVRDGASIIGLYPPDEKTLRAYEHERSRATSG